MNTLLVVTRNNLEEMKSVSRELGERQKSSNAGKLLITGGYYLDDDSLREIAEPLSNCYEVTELTKVQVSPNQADATKIAVMIATFFMQRYTTAPGPWLIIDSRFEINTDNPLSIIEKSHNQENQENTGRATTSGGGRVPIGPVLIGADVNRLKILRSVSGDNWRARGRWAFNLCSWNQMSPQDYPFRIPTIEAGDEANSGIDGDVLAPGEAKVVEITKNENPHNLPIVDYAPPKQKENEMHNGYQNVPLGESTPLSAAEVAEMKISEIEDQDDIPVAPKEIDNSDASKQFLPITPDNYETAPREILLDQVHKRSGKKPHPRTGDPKLIKA